MGGIFTSMVSTAGAMRALQTSLNVVQNNIVNASTAGYVRQEGSLVANPFNPGYSSTSGGVTAGPMASARTGFLEAAVWKGQQRAGYSEALAIRLREMERIFPVTDGAGIPGEVDRFFASVSQWGVSPNDPVARRQVLDRASGLAESFRRAATDLGDAAGQAASDLTSAVRQVNRLIGEIATLNERRRESFGSAGDAGLDASLHAKLEELATYTNFTALGQEDGSVSVYLGGQTPAVIGNRQWPVTLTYSGGQYAVQDSEGGDITGRLRGGKVGALLEYRNVLIPAYQARLDGIASGLADAVNGVLAGGLDQNGATPVQNLFTYNAGTGAAATLSVNPLTPAELAGAETGDPGGNTNVWNLMDVAAAGIIGGLAPAEAYATLAADIGQRWNGEEANRTLEQQRAMQARAVRSELTGVDINEEATKLLQLQKGFQAAGQVMSVLNSLTETLINLIR